MTASCKTCYSYAINPHTHGREAGVDLDLCDVCYWRKRAAPTGPVLTDDEAEYLFEEWYDADDIGPELVRATERAVLAKLRGGA